MNIRSSTAVPLRTALRGLLTASAAGATLLALGDARAAGLYFSDRGVRPLARGGAFVAGADDAGAIYYNPAGLAYTGQQLLFDAAWLNFSSLYQRKISVQQKDPNTGDPIGPPRERTLTEVEGSSPVIPIPTLAYSHPVNPDITIALGAWAPYAAIATYPETVKGKPSPQRYSLLSLEGSALAILGAYGAYKPIKEVAIGLGVEVLAGNFNTSVAFSACVPDRFICAPEQPEYDAISQLKVGPIVAPTGTAGIIINPIDALKIGVSYHLPIVVNAPATIDVRLPSAAVFTNASQVGRDANVQFDLAQTLRAGVEVKPTDTTAVEAAFVYEFWGAHDAITVTPENISLNNVEAFPREYAVSPITLERGFQGAWSARLGGEQRVNLGGYDIDLRLGGMYETSAVPRPYLSATTVDLNKLTLAAGFGLHIGKWRFDGLIGRVFGFEETVSLSEARINAVNPVRANPSEESPPINAGLYQASANVLGIGLAYQFDSPAKPKTQPGLSPPRTGAKPARATPKPPKTERSTPKPSTAKPATEPRDEDLELKPEEDEELNLPDDS